jgi:hypothetical protein
MASSQSLNHLLNFSLPPRQSQPFSALPRRSNRRTGSNYAVWNKERFVNAQYRFVMHPGGDYTVHFADPDIFFQWQNILQVIIPRSSALASSMTSGTANYENEGHVTCPVCLSPPTAPRMTKCGHVFCFPCILHYLSTSENKWARCPICFDSVNEKQLKSVKWFDGASLPKDTGTESLASSSSSTTADTIAGPKPMEGSFIRMRLMERPQISTLALPRSHTWPSDLLPPHQAPFHFQPDVYNFAKFMLATPLYLIEDLTRDLNELAAERRSLAGMHDDLGVSFVDASEERVLRQIAKAELLDTPQLKEAVQRAERDQKEIEDRIAYHERRRQEQAQLVPLEPDITNVDNETHLQSIPPARTFPKQRRNVNPPPPSTSYYYYQASSGYPLFLHPLDIRILLSHFNVYSAFPDTITVRVEASSEGTVNEDLRKRCKYLAHVPEGADVVFIEADLEGVVGQAGIRTFEGPLKTRRNKRKERERKDERAKVKAEERDRDRAVETASVWRFSSSAPAPPPPPRPDTPPLIASPTPTSQQAGGAWGNRSFASALHSASGTPRRNPASNSQAVSRHDDDDLDADALWYELEQRSSGGRKKRSNKLVVLGSGGSRRR